MIVSPLNYCGSKSEIVPEILQVLPKEISVFVDAFGGAFNVGINVSAKKVIYNEFNPYVFEMVKWLTTVDRTKLVETVESIVESYGLKPCDVDAYKQLRVDYNKTHTTALLYCLTLYSFQHLLRYNNKHEFNMPVGNSGYNESVRERLLNFVPSCEIEYLNKDYVDLDYDGFDQHTVFYFDPPYFTTVGDYNDGKRGMKGWSLTEEIEFHGVLEKLIQQGRPFVLSNVLDHNGKENTLLKEFINKHSLGIKILGVHGRRYRKTEVLVSNLL